jgi:hypothetical protein
VIFQTFFSAGKSARVPTGAAVIRYLCSEIMR